MPFHQGGDIRVHGTGNEITFPVTRLFR